MDPAARFRLRHALHPVDAGLEFQSREDTAARYRCDDFLVAAGLALARRQHFDAPALARGVSLVHAEEIAGKEGCFRATRTGADFENRALFVAASFGRSRIWISCSSASIFSSTSGFSISARSRCPCRSPGRQALLRCRRARQSPSHRRESSRRPAAARNIPRPASRKRRPTGRRTCAPRFRRTAAPVRASFQREALPNLTPNALASPGSRPDGDESPLVQSKPVCRSPQRNRPGAGGSTCRI